MSSISQPPAPTIQFNPRDRLSSSPPEILSMIFKHVRELNGEQQMVGAISKHLLPYTRANLLHMVRVRSYSSLALLVRAINDSEVLGDYVELLFLALVIPRAQWDDSNIDSDGPELVHRELQDPRTITNRSFDSFFRRLHRIRLLSIMGCPVRLAKLLLSPQIVHGAMPMLDSLSLGGKFAAWANPLAVRHYEHVECSSIFSLCLDFYRTLESIRDNESDTPEEDEDDDEDETSSSAGSITEVCPTESSSIERHDSVQLEEAPSLSADTTNEDPHDPHSSSDNQSYITELDSDSDIDSDDDFRVVTSLSIVGPLAHPSSAELITSFPCLCMLDLFDNSSTPNLKHILEAVEASLINYLVLASAKDLPSPLDDLLRRFTSVDYLSLGGGTFSDDLFSFLRDPLPLEELTFGPDAEVSAARLKGLLKDDGTGSRLTKLKRLELNMVYPGMVGTRIAEDADFVLCDRTEDGIYDDWTLPDWPNDYSLVVAEGIVGMAKALDPPVEIVGDILKAIEVDEAFFEDMALADDMNKGFLTDDSEFGDYYGYGDLLDM